MKIKDKEEILKVPVVGVGMRMCVLKKAHAIQKTIIRITSDFSLEIEGRGRWNTRVYTV